MNENRTVNEKAKAARIAYNKENIRTLGTTIRKDYAEQFKALAEKRGTTAGAMIKSYIMDELGKEERPNQPMLCETYHPCTAILTNRNMDRLKHETARHNPRNYNPDQLLNHILDNYFKMVKEIRAEG